jgi:S-DNA-T family DNA segregation ATPase FtsK/SpoIIIE
MATNRDLLKEAIADAKAVKETAIANAKAALEEAFTPQLKTMFAAKLQEMEEMDEMEDKDMYEMEDKESMKEGEDETMNEIDLEELLAELEEEEGMEESLNEAEEEEEDMEMSDEESEEGEEEGEPLDLEDMTDEDLKSMIEDVIKDMIEAGELEAGHEGEGEEEAEETGIEDEEEVDLAELLREIEEIEEMEEMEEPIDELFGIKPGAVRRLEKMFPDTAAKLMGAKSDEEKKRIFDTELRAEGPFKKSFGSNTQSYRADLGSLEDFFKISSTFKPSLGADSAAGALGQANEAMKDELDEALSTIEALKSELNEINLLNAKLLYTNKIFKSKNLNENQKVKVLSSFDKAKTVGEVKMVFETLNEGIKVNKNTIKENLGSASKAMVTPNAKKPIVESNEAFLRMQKLAGII